MTCTLSKHVSEFTEHLQDKGKRESGAQSYTETRYHVGGRSQSYHSAFKIYSWFNTCFFLGRHNKPSTHPWCFCSLEQQQPHCWFSPITALLTFDDKSSFPKHLHHSFLVNLPDWKFIQLLCDHVTLDLGELQIKGIHYSVAKTLVSSKTGFKSWYCQLCEFE